jgi:ribonuclease P protein component
MIACLVHSADFQRLLSSPAWSRSAHFAIHHLPVSPQRHRSRVAAAAGDELSTVPVNNTSELVDKLPGNLPDRHWLGAVLPKRLARRAVTRNLLRRQIRAAVQRHAPSLPQGLWVVRLRAGFARTEFPSAASDALRQATRTELDLAFQRRRT